MLVTAGHQHVAPDTDSKIADWWLQTRDADPDKVRRAFDSLVLLVTWIIWKERNGRVFDCTARTSSQVLDAITAGLNAYIATGYRCLGSLSLLLVAG